MGGYLKLHKFLVEGHQYELAAADLPTHYRVTPALADRRLVIRLELLYPAAMGEPREAKAPMGPVRIEVGRVSRRLMAIEIDAGAAVAAVGWPSLGSQLARSVASAIDSLKIGVSEGPRLNYQATEDGLNLDATMPPGWLIEALRSTEASPG